MSDNPAEGLAEQAQAIPAPSQQSQSPDPQASTAQQPKHGSFMESKTFIIIPVIIIIIVVIAGVFLLTNRGNSSSTSTIDTTTIASIVNSSNNSTTIATTSLAATSGGTCPCLGESQIQTILNDSQADKTNAAFNIMFEDSAAKLFNATNVSQGELSSVPANITSSITGGWLLRYNSSSPASFGSENETVAEYVIQSSVSGAQSFYNYYQAQQKAQGGKLAGGSINGFNYNYANLTFFGLTIDTVFGYKNNNIILFLLESPNNGISTPNSIASTIASTLP